MRRLFWHLRWLTPLAALSLGGALAARAILTAPCQVDTVAGAPRPNIVVIVFDDLDVSLTPQLPRWDAIARQAVEFDESFVTSPLCCPSRVSMLTGLLASHHGVYTNQPPTGGQKRAIETGAERCTAAVWLDQAGYGTALIGKYLNGYGYETGPEEIPPGWDRWEALWGLKRYTGYTINVDGTLVHPRQYLTDELADRAVAFLQSAQAPFFLLLTPFTPHVPEDPAPRYAAAQVPVGADPARYRMMLAGMDLLNRVIVALPADTYVFVSSDNGYHRTPEPGKGLPQDSDTRVPLLVLGPGVKPHHDGHLVANIDVAPTLADWAGVQAPATDGRSFSAAHSGSVGAVARLAADGDRRRLVRRADP